MTATAELATIVNASWVLWLLPSSESLFQVLLFFAAAVEESKTSHETKELWAASMPELCGLFNGLLSRFAEWETHIF